ncbi:MAG: hypothetical protein AAGB22_08570 [Bacteroidota bacterium]
MKYFYPTFFALALLCPLLTHATHNEGGYITYRHLQGREPAT